MQQLFKNSKIINPKNLIYRFCHIIFLMPTINLFMEISQCIITSTDFYFKIELFDWQKVKQLF